MSYVYASKHVFQSLNKLVKTKLFTRVLFFIHQDQVLSNDNHTVIIPTSCSQFMLTPNLWVQNINSV